MKSTLKWIAGVILLLAGLGILTAGGITSAIFYILAGIVCIPPSLNFIEGKLNVKLQTWQKYAVVIGGLIIGGVAMPKSMTNKNGQTGGETASPTSNVNEKEEPKVEYKKIGDAIEVGNFVYRVEGVQFKKKLGNEFVSETADGIFLLVQMSIKNISKESRTLDNSMFKLVDEQEAEYESSTRGTTAVEMSGGQTLFLKQCQPNIQTSGLLVFEVPSEAVYDLKLSGGFWSGKTAAVKLTGE
ncbi:MAG: hypothetical protein OHK0019_09390 [Saprospiraceae bacterium]